MTAALFMCFCVRWLHYKVSLYLIEMFLRAVFHGVSIVCPQLLNALEKELKVLLNGNITRVKRSVSGDFAPFHACCSNIE